MRAEVVRLLNPFDPAQRETAVLRRPLRIRRMVPRGRPVLVMLNGKPLMQAGWRRRLRDGDRLALILLPRGGGGRGGGGSNPFRLILSLALMAFAPMAAGWLFNVPGTVEGLASTATLFGSFTVGQATALGIYMAGNALINAVLPAQRAQTLPTPSPTYALQAQGNAARLDAPIPVQYGRLKVFPDFAAQPYAEFSGNEQYLYQLLCLGAGEFEIEQLLIEDTPIDAFSEIELQVVEPGESPTLFPTAVITSVEVSGQELAGAASGTYVKSGTTITIAEADHGRATSQVVQLEFPYPAPSNGSYFATPAGAGRITVAAPAGIGSGTVSGHWVEESGEHTISHSFDGTWIRSGTTITITAAAAAAVTIGLIGLGGVPGTATTVNLTFVSLTGPTEVLPIGPVTDEDSYVLTSATSGSASGAVTIRPIVGGVAGFVANAAETQAHRLGLDILMPRGLYAMSDDGTLSSISLSVRFEARQIDDAGTPLGDWVLLGEETVTDRTNTPQRVSYSYSVPPGRYRVRAWRLDRMSTDTSAGHEVMLASLRAYLAEPQDFGPVTLLALRMRASNNLSLQASRKIAVICTRKLPIWTGTAWSAPAPTRSIAWALADAARNTQYGASLGIDRLDLPALLALDALWTARGDHFDGRFDSVTTWWEAARKITMAGRAQPFMQGGILRVVRDGPATTPVMLFSERNIIKGTFGIDFTMPSDDTADAVDVGIFDSLTWAPRRIRAALPDSSAETPVKIELFGVTGADHGLREGLYQAAANRFRRETVSFDTEMEGFLPSIGDLIAVQHAMPGWGQQAEVTAWSAALLRLTVTEPLDWSGEAHMVGLRSRTGAVIGPYAATRGDADNVIVLAEMPAESPFTGSDAERTHIAFGTVDTWRALAKVVGVRPRGLYRVGIDAVIEDPSVHTAEAGAIAPPVSYSSLPRTPVLPLVAQLLARMVPDDPDRVVLSWRPAPGADLYQIEMAEGADLDDPDVSWTRVAETTSSQILLTVLHTARTMVRVRGVGLAPGPWISAAVGSLVGLYWLHPAAPFWGTDTDIHWRP